MKKFIGTLAVVALVLAVLTACLGTGMVRKDRIAETGRIAIVSVVMPRIADTTGTTTGRRSRHSYNEPLAGSRLI